MNKTNLVHIEDVVPEMTISLRGSLADMYSKMLQRNQKRSAKRLLNMALHTSRPEVLRYKDGEMLVIGLTEEKGKYLPDW